MWRWHFLEHFSCTIHMQYKDTRGEKDHAFRCFRIARACLKNHFRNLQAPLCGIFYLRSVAVARYAASFGKTIISKRGLLEPVQTGKATKSISGGKNRDRNAFFALHINN